MAPYDPKKDEGLTLSDELAKRAAEHARPKPQLFDIEKSDEEFFGTKKTPSQPIPTPPATPPTPPITPKKNVYKPNSFTELPPDIDSTPAKSTEPASEPTRVISRQAIERQMKSPSDGVNSYGDKQDVNPYYSMPQQTPVRPSKPFKLHISDEDFNSIPDFDNRSRQAQPASRDAVVSNRRTRSVSNAAQDEFDYVPPSASQRPQTSRGNKTMRSLGRLANGIIYTIGVLFASILLSIFILQSMSDVLGLFKSEKEITITIPEKATTQQVASILKDNGVISQPLTFRLYTKYRNYEDTYLTGSFELNSNMSYDEIINIIQVERNKKKEVTITFIEGVSVLDIAKQLEENNVCSSQEFINTLNTTEFGYEFEKLIPTGGNRYLKLEGYLFPDTYTFFVDESPKSVAKKFLSNFNKKITADLLTRIEKMDMTLDEALTLASIIQKEGRTLDDMYMVSSVFNNRLKKPKTFPFLQSDVTINYVNDNIFPFVSNEEDKQAYASAYNTYKCEGLPVGPVCNPGINAIKAAIYPDDTPYYYFLTDAEMNYYFASSLAEHESNLAKAKKVGDDVGGVATHEEQ